MQIDLSIDLGLDRGHGSAIRSVRHGERAVVRSNNIDRLVRASGRWLQAITVEPPPERLVNMTAAVCPDGQVVVVPRWITADTALMERLAPEVNWADDAWVEVVRFNGSISALADARRIKAVVIDGAGVSLDMTTRARRAANVLPMVTARTAADKFDIGCELASATDRWVVVDTSNIAAACRRAASLIKDD